MSINLRPATLLRSSRGLWIIFWVAVTLLYLPAWKGGFQQDFQGWLQIYQELPFWKILNRQFAAVNSFYHLTQLELYVLTWLFDVRPLPWFLLFTALHALNGTMLYRLCRKVMEDFGLAHAGWIAMGGTLLGLFNPAMTEVVLWKACFHYLVGLQAILWMLLWARKYLLTGRAAYAWRSAILFAALTFTLEIWYTIPWLILTMAVAYYRSGLVQKAALRRTLTGMFLPQIVMFLAHLVAYRIVYGIWLAHTSSVTPENNTLLKMGGRIWSYEFVLLFQGRFFPREFRLGVFEYLGGNAGGAIAIAAIAGFAVLAYVRFPRWGARSRVAALLVGWSLISLIIVLRYAPPEILLVSNDRYLYFTAFFQYMLVAVGFAALLRHRPRWRTPALAALLLVLTGFTAVLVMHWRHATKTFWAVQDKFVWKDAPLVLLLNMPCNYNGIGIINSGPPSDLPDHLRVFHKGQPRGKVYDVSGYNMQHPWDGAHVTVIDSTHLKVTLNQWGSWWWYRGFGATDYSNEYYDLHFTDPSHEYILTLKQIVPGMVILYQQGLEWRVVNMQQTRGEQW